jgi:beta-1,4-mannosyl-glycoprotein beta-1,4-N-acetylglucosaminyltransferase
MNELDLLEIRLNYLKDSVDYFVIAESTVTHSGKPKPLHFQENEDRYKEFENKIIHIVVDDMPLDNLRNNGNRWALENHQRNALRDGLTNCNGDDIILISDVDEIPNIDAIGKFGAFNQICYMYYLNTKIEDNWPGTVSLPYGDILDKEAGIIQQMRDKRNHYTRIPNGGWHFAWLGGYEKVLYKLEAFAHTELDNDTYKINLENCVKNRIALWVPDATEPMKTVKIDETYPKYLRDNLDRYQHLIYHEDKI